MSNSIDEFGILDEDDIVLMESQDGPALNSVIGDEPYWESYNEWNCFPVDLAEIKCFDPHEYREPTEFDPDDADERSYFPTIGIHYEDFLVVAEWSVPVELNRCLEQTEIWKELMKEQLGFCIFAANAPIYPPDANVGYWVIYGFKTLLGEELAPIYQADPVLEE